MSERTYPALERRRQITREQFYAEYVDRRPVVLEGLMDDWFAFGGWTTEYFRSQVGDMRVKVKVGDIAQGQVDYMPLARYLDLVEEFEARLERGEATPENRPAYLHDIPLLAQAPELVEDVQPFLTDFLPRFYRDRWWLFAQFFYGPSHSLTPMHFDTLETHNIFFQVVGTKKFSIINREERDRCAVFDWRWSRVDPENLDLETYPQLAEVEISEALVGPGDILYMPPGTLHHVRSLDMTVSFNIDWQTAGTAVRAVCGLFRGMPLTNVYYNSVLALGLCTGLPSWAVYPLYRSYLDYIS